MDDFTWPPKDLAMYIRGATTQRLIAPIPKKVTHQRYPEATPEEATGSSSEGDPTTGVSGGLTVQQGDSQPEATEHLPEDSGVLPESGDDRRRQNKKQKRGGRKTKRNRSHRKGRSK